MASFPPFLELMHFALDLNRGHKLTGLHHLTRSTVAVIYCNNFQYGHGVKWLHFCHGSHGYSQTEVPAFMFTLLSFNRALDWVCNCSCCYRYVLFGFVWSSDNCTISMLKFRTSTFHKPNHSHAVKAPQENIL